MARKSAAARSITPLGENPRPDPPAELTERQAREWREVVARMPVEWFGRETHGLLTQYCRHIALADKLAAEIEKAEGQELLAFARLQQNESAAIANLALKMRLSQLSSYDNKNRKTQVATSSRRWGRNRDAPANGPGAGGKARGPQH